MLLPSLKRDRTVVCAILLKKASNPLGKVNLYMYLSIDIRIYTRIPIESYEPAQGNMSFA